jgi:hypothetical protein
MRRVAPFDARAYYYYYGGGAARRRVSGGAIWIPSGTELFTDAAWNKVGVTVDANVAVAPDGTTTGDKIIEADTTATHGAFQGVAMAAGVRTVQVYFKAGERTHGAVSAVNPAGDRYAALFDLSTGAVVDTDTVGSPTGTSETSSSFGNGWFLCAVTILAGAGDGFMQIGLSDTASPSWANNLPTYDGDGVSGIFAWGGRTI